MKKLSRTIIDLALVTAIILVPAYHMGLLTGFPKGNDVYGYLTKIRLIDTYFPHINWNPFWDSGTPFSIWSYPPLPMTFTTFFFVRLLGFTAEKALMLMAAMSFILLAWGLYGLVKETTGKRLAGLLTVVLFVSSPASWNWWALGNYVRVFGLGFFALSLWAMTGYFKKFLADQEGQNLHRSRHAEFSSASGKILKKVQDDKRRKGFKARGWFWATLVLLSLAVSSHLLMGGITMMIVFAFIFFAVPSFSQKINYWLKFGVLPFLTAAYYYLPLFLTGKAGGRFIGLNPAYPIPLPNWFYPVEACQDFSLSPALSLMFLTGFFLFLVFAFFKKIAWSQFEKASFWTFGLFALGNTAYNSLGFLPFYPETFYIVGLPPIGAFALNSLAWAIGAGLFLGILLSRILTKGRLASVVILILIFVGGLNVFLGFRPLKLVVRDLTEYGTVQDLTQQIVRLENPREFNYRFGTDSGHMGDWFTWRYDMPQTRDYFAQGIPHVNWQNWMETAIWAWDDNYPETNFLLDWYAVKYIFIAEPHFNYDKFLARPEFYSVAVEKTFTQPAITFYQFAYNDPQPILAATNTPPVLIVGEKEEYDVFLRSLGQTGLGPQQVIPVFIDQPVDRLSLQEIKKFKAVFLYNYSYQDRERFVGLLSDYVSSGGCLFLETFRGPEKEADSLPEFFPVLQTKKADVDLNWDFLPSRSSLLKGVNLTIFAEASYRGDPWHISLSPSSSLRPEAEAILANSQGILMASQKLGQGKVIWSGINFPFHLADKKSPDEITLWQNLFTWFGLGRKEKIPASIAEFVHPEKRIITIDQPAKGILFKEIKFMDWHVKLCAMQSELCTKPKIYFAGPGFMYVFLDPNQAFPAQITFTYCLSWLEKISFLIAFLAWVYLALLGLEVLLGKTLTSGINFGIGTEPLSRKIAGWWDREEE